jgi:hypothetical protein
MRHTDVVRDELVERSRRVGREIAKTWKDVEELWKTSDYELESSPRCLVLGLRAQVRFPFHGESPCIYAIERLIRLCV